MARMDDDVVVDREYLNEGWVTMADIQTYIREAPKRAQEADARTLALAKVHQQGWANLAVTVGQGLAAVAEAIRALTITE